MQAVGANLPRANETVQKEAWGQREAWTVKELG